MKDYNDFISKGPKPFWLTGAFKKYIKTLSDSEMIRYLTDLHEFLDKKGINSEDRLFLKKMNYNGLWGDAVFKTGNKFTHDEANKITEELEYLQDKYFTKECLQSTYYDLYKERLTSFLFSFDYVARFQSGKKQKDVKFIFKDRQDYSDFLKEFQEKMHIINNRKFTNRKTAHYVYYLTDVEVKLSTLLDCLDRKI